MSNRSFAYLAAAVLALGVFIWFFERHEPTTDEAEQQENKVFSNLTANDIQGLKVRNAHGLFDFARDTRGGWRLTAPLEGAADAFAVDGVISSVLELEVDRTLGSDEVDAAAYGLEAPELAVTLITTEGARQQLLIGDTAPLGGKRAISRGDGDILLTSGAFASGLNKELDEWRSRNLVEARLADLVSIEITTGGDSIDAVKVGEDWRLRSPITDLADSELLRTFVTDITSVRIESFVDGEVDSEGLGLTRPRHHIMLVPADGGEGATLDFGSTREVDGNTQVVCRRNGKDVFWVNNRAETVLGKAPVRWREPRVRPFETWDAAGLALVTGDDSLTLRRSSGLWTFEDGEQADATSVQERLTALAGLEAVDFDLMDLGTVELGRATVALDETGSKTLVFVFSEPLGEGGNVLVRVTGREVLMSVQPDDVEHIFGNLAGLRRAPEEQDPPVESEENDLV